MERFYIYKMSLFVFNINILKILDYKENIPRNLINKEITRLIKKTNAHTVNISVTN
jgi:hypothetical protein